MRSRYKILENDGVHFITSTIVEWIPVITKKEYFEIIIESLTYCKINKNMQLYGYVILDNHFHLLASGPDLSNAIRSLKRHTANSFIDLLKTEKNDWILNQLVYFKKKYKTESKYQVWQEGFHPEIIQSEEMFLQKLEYLHNNPVNRGYVDKPEHWIYSSARNYSQKDNTIIELDFLE
jgi:putative transposase